MNKKLVTRKAKNESDYFASYAREVNVIGFKQRWVTEINNEMREVYEKEGKEKNWVDKKRDKVWE